MCLFQLRFSQGICPVMGLLGHMVVLEKAMATHSSTLAWRIPWREEPGRLQSMGLQRVGHDLACNTQEDEETRAPSVMGGYKRRQPSSDL